jgi:hypothetical protein
MVSLRKLGRWRLQSERFKFWCCHVDPTETIGPAPRECELLTPIPGEGGGVCALLLRLHCSPVRPAAISNRGIPTLGVEGQSLQGGCAAAECFDERSVRPRAVSRGGES